MRCPVQRETPDLLLSYCAGRLDADMTADVRRHLTLCSECRDIVAGNSDVWNALDGLTPCRVSPDFDASLYARIEAENARSWRAMLPSGHGSLAFAAVCAALLITFLLRSPASPTDQPIGPEAVNVEMLEPEQIDRAIEDMDMLRQFSNSPGRKRSI